jgi:hypothetical protein
MELSHALQPDPRLQQLQQRCAELRQLLRQLTQQWLLLHTEEYARRQRLYEQHFHALEQELEWLAWQTAQLRRRLELLLVKLQRGEPLTAKAMRLIEQTVEHEFARLRPRSERTAPVEPAEEELARLYRLLVKRLHPDSTGEETEEYRRYWLLVQQAYRERNVEQLRRLVRVLCEEPVGESPVCELDPLQYWQRELARLEAQVRVEQQRLRRTLAQEPFSLPLDDPEWVRQHRAELERRIAQQRAQMQWYAELLRRLSCAVAPEDLTP